MLIHHVEGVHYNGHPTAYGIRDASERIPATTHTCYACKTDLPEGRSLCTNSPCDNRELPDLHVDTNCALTPSTMRPLSCMLSMAQIQMDLSSSSVNLILMGTCFKKGFICSDANSNSTLNDQGSWQAFRLGMWFWPEAVRNKGWNPTILG